MAGRPKRADGRKSKTVANNNYTRRTYDRVAVNVKKGMRDVMKDYASERGETLNVFINKLLAAEIPGFDPIENTPEWAVSDKNRKNN